VTADASIFHSCRYRDPEASSLKLFDGLLLTYDRIQGMDRPI
jgi:hypothetical protein